MSRVAKQPISIPKGVELKIDGQKVTAKGPKGNEEIQVHDDVEVVFEDAVLGVKPRTGDRGGAVSYTHLTLPTKA